VGARQLAVAIRPDHEHSYGLFDRRHVAQQKEAARVGPLEIVEDEDNGLMRRHRGQQAHHGGEEQEPFGVGVGGLRRWEVRDSAGQGRHQPGQFRAVGLDVGWSWSSGAWVT
jgi:hypothetical protein